MSGAFAFMRQQAVTSQDTFTGSVVDRAGLPVNGVVFIFDSFPLLVDSVSVRQQRPGPRADVIDANAVFSQHDRGRGGRAEAFHAEHVAA